MRERKTGPLLETGDPYFELLAMICRQAVRDARAGQGEARVWLEDFCPEWRKWEVRYSRIAKMYPKHPAKDWVRPKRTTRKRYARQ